jgi:hypothetical protein
MIYQYRTDQWPNPWRTCIEEHRIDVFLNRFIRKKEDKY